MFFMMYQLQQKTLAEFNVTHFLHINIFAKKILHTNISTFAALTDEQ